MPGDYRPGCVAEVNRAAAAGDAEDAGSAESRPTVRVLAMAPYDKLVGPALQAVDAAAQVEVNLVAGGRVDSGPDRGVGQTCPGGAPDLVLVAVPVAVTPRPASPPEEAIRAYTWILNWSLSFGLQQWDVVGIAPSVLKADLNPEEMGRRGVRTPAGFSLRT